MSSGKSTQLSELERKAQEDAVKRVIDLFRKPEQLEKIDLIRSRLVNQKTATEAQLKVALHSQLDGSKVGLDKLDAALKESQQYRFRLFELNAILDDLPGLPGKLRELQNISTKYSQLAAAMENMSYLVKLPEVIEQARAYLGTENLLDAHKILQESEGVRDELMSEMHGEHSRSDLETVRDYFKGVNELNALFQSKIVMVGSRISNAVITERRLVVDCVRAIDREERSDAIWEKRSENSQFRPHCRPKRWKKLLFDSMASVIREKVLESALDSDNDKNKLVRHNEAIRQHTLADLKIAKNICPTYFPPDYGIFDRFVEMYHDAIGAHVEAMVQEGLNDTQIVQLLGWINSYHTDEFMKEPALNIDFSRLNLQYPINLLPEDKLDNLREQYVSKTIERLSVWLTNSLNKDLADWRHDTPPELDGSSYYFTGLPVFAMTPLNEMIGKGNLLQFLGGSVRESFLIKCVDQMNSFVAEYDEKLRQYHMSYKQDRSQFPYFIEYILANANNALVISESFTSVVSEELIDDTLLKGRLQSQLNKLKDQFQIVSKHCRYSAEETIMMDIDKPLKCVFTRLWLKKDDVTARLFAGTLEDYDGTLHHVRPNIYAELVDSLAERVLIEYIKVIIESGFTSSKRLNFASDSERRTAGDKIMCDFHALRGYLVNTMHVKDEVVVAYSSLSLIAQFFHTSDVSMLSLDLINLIREFPDVRSEQLINIIMARNDFRANDAKELAAENPSSLDMKPKSSPLHLFTKVADACRRPKI